MRVAILDFDKTYIKALLGFLMKKVNNEYFTFSSLEDFLAPAFMGGEKYDIGLIGRDYYRELENVLSNPESMQMKSLKIDGLFNRIIVLDDRDEGRDSLAGVEYVYKYGSMEGLLGLLGKSPVREIERGNTENRNSSYLIYAPTHHELSEVFALAFSQMLSEGQSVLLVDLDPQARILTMMQRQTKLSLLDCLYLLLDEEEVNFDEFLQYYQDVAIFPTAVSPEELCDIRSEHWKALVDSINGMGFENIVFLISDINLGFVQVASRVDEIILLNKKGEFYQEIQDGFENYLRVEKRFDNILPITLPMSANNLGAGSVQLEELLMGNLGKYVRSVNYDYKSS